MKKIFVWSLLVVVCVWLVWCSRPGTEEVDLDGTQAQKEIFYIETSTVWDLKQSNQLKKNGILLWADTVTVTAQIWWRVSAVESQIGNDVNQWSRIITMADSAGSISFGVERARASLDQARINYEQTLLGIDQQIDETKRGIRQAQNQAESAAIQANNAQLEWSSSAQLQLDQLEQSLRTAKLDLETKVNADDQQIKNFVSSANNIRRDAQILYKEVLEETDQILGVTPLNQRENDRFEKYLSARNTGLKFRAETELRQLITTKNVLDWLIINQWSLTADLEYIQDKLNSLIPFLQLVEEVLLYSTTWNSFSDGELQWLNAKIDGLQSAVQWQASWITQQVNGIESFLRTYQAQQESIQKNIDGLQIQVQSTRESLKTAQQSIGVTVDTAGLWVESAQATLQNLQDNRVVTQRSLSNSIRQAEIALREIQTNAGKFTVEAPIAGSIGEILVDTWQEVNPGTPLFTITSTSELEIEIGLTSNEVDLVKEWQTVSISDWQQEYDGIVDSITRTANQSLTYKAKITPSQKPSLLWKVVSVRIPLEDNALLLPLKNITIVTTDLWRITTFQEWEIKVLPVALWPIQWSSITILEALNSDLEIITSPVRTYDPEKYTVEIKK